MSLRDCFQGQLTSAFVVTERNEGHGKHRGIYVSSLGGASEFDDESFGVRLRAGSHVADRGVNAETADVAEKLLVNSTSAFAAARSEAGRDAAQRFYSRLAIALAAIVFLAFTRRYWAPLAHGTLDLPRAVHIHAALFFLWMIFFVVQTTLVASGRVSLHRALGLLGISIATAMVITGVVATTVSLKAGLAGPNPQFARLANALSLFAMMLFSLFITLAIANIRRSELHKRFMVLATFSILQAAIARVIQFIPAISFPQRTTIGAVVVDVMLLGVIAIDTRLHRRLHPAYALGFALLLAAQVSRMLVLKTAWWTRFGDWLAG
jgi:hypothetical protein